MRTILNAPKIMTVNHWLVKPDDPDVGVISYEVKVFQEITKERQKLTVYRANSRSDTELDHVAFSTTIDTCKFLSGTIESIFSKVVNQFFFDSLTPKNLSCPYQNGLEIKSTNGTYTDFFLPPIPTEIRIRVEKAVIGLLKGEKKWTKLYTMQLYAIVKK